MAVNIGHMLGCQDRVRDLQIVPRRGVHDVVEPGGIIQQIDRNGSLSTIQAVPLCSSRTVLDPGVHHPAVERTELKLALPIDSGDPPAQTSGEGFPARGGVVCRPHQRRPTLDASLFNDALGQVWSSNWEGKLRAKAKYCSNR